ncbi:rRNA pseudouridine synthase [Thermosulfurimonas marina]|uniref:Pseudouridine synthase n=1 Tax=Thermosulfurimonas marina TaxID=2047767 RepID=A0A6H1WQR1_9BACT|nr:pseudouridine synthase [Thermosulfurimonas marina]QJA05494.1 rRNA pseudouridine synthase [Thermosulfurimonas marina]
MRLDRYLAEAGYGTRRETKRLILKRHVTVNGRLVRDPAYQVGPGEEVRVDGKPVSPPARKRYFLFYKPAGYVTSTADKLPTVMEFFREIPRHERLFPVGRLDRDAEGLLLVTDDGELAHRLLHPKYAVPRVYRVRVSGEVSEKALEPLRRGMEIAGERFRPAEVRILERGKGEALLEITLTEGRYHEVKRLLSAVGLKVKHLLRMRFGPLALGNLRPGEYRELTEEEIQRLTTSGPRPPR